jgi:hypothetical protein
MNRPLSTKKTVELETLFQEARDSPAQLRLLLEELKHRSTRRAAELRAKVQGTLTRLVDGGAAEPLPKQLELPFGEQ